MKANINEVARMSGYSKTSVSFAFNAPSRISVAAREKILKVAEEIGYFPSPAARHLSMQRVGSIGFLTPHGVQDSFLNPYIVEVFRGISSTMQLHGLAVTVVSMDQDVIVDAVHNSAVGGFISLGLRPEPEVYSLILRRRIPFVTIDVSPLEGISSVNIRDRKAATEQLNMLLAQGHRNIGIIGFELPESSREASAGDIFTQRLIGYDLALKEAGMDLVGSAAVPLVYAPATIEGGCEATRRLIRDYPEITAIASMSDIATTGVYYSCDELGLSIPGDISVVGFDDIPHNHVLRPALSTISQPGFRKGQTAAQVLLEKMEDPDTYVHRMLAYSIVQGQSIAAPHLVD